jgi:hypothetical protein
MRPDGLTKLLLALIALGIWFNVFSSVRLLRGIHADVGSMQTDVSSMQEDIGDIQSGISALGDGTCTNNRLCP